MITRYAIAKNVLFYIFFVSGLILAILYPFTSIPVWIPFVASFLVYGVGSSCDFLTTRAVVSRFGIEYEESPLYGYLYRRFGFRNGNLIGMLLVEPLLVGALALIQVVGFDRDFLHAVFAALIIIGSSQLGAGIGNFIVIHYLKKSNLWQSVSQKSTT